MSVIGTEIRVSRYDQVWLRLYRCMLLLGQADVRMEAETVRFLMDQISKEECLGNMGIERREREGARREEVLP
jgi:hypothetical protein